jgi:hypothetical protein
MLPGDWTAELGRQRMAEFHRQAEHQRLARLARARRRGGTGAWGVGGAGWRVRDEVRCGPHGGALDRASHSATVGDAVRSS